MSLESTGARYVPQQRGQISYEYFHRYAIAASLSGGKRVLDACSGEGYGSALLARVAASVVGIDGDERRVEQARRSHYAANVRFVRGSLTELPLADASVDVAVAFETIEHLNDHGRMIDELRRVLAPGGVLVISSSNKFVSSDLAGYDNPYHERELYFPEFRDLLAGRFAHVHLYGQRIAASSIVHPLGGGTSASGTFYGGATVHGHGLPTLPDPVSFLAVCSQEPLDLDASSSYLDPSHDLLADLWRDLNALRRAEDAPRTEVLAAPEDSQAEAQMVRLRDELAQSQAAFLLADAELTAATAQVGQLEFRIAARERELADVRRAANEAQDAAAAAHAALADALIREREAGERSAELAAVLRADVAALREAADTSGTTCDAERARATVVADDMAERFARLKGQNDTLRHGLDESTRALAAQDAQNLELASRLAAVTQELANAARDAEALRQVLDSRSWKITAPFRRAVRSLRR